MDAPLAAPVGRDARELAELASVAMGAMTFSEDLADSAALTAQAFVQAQMPKAKLSPEGIPESLPDYLDEVEREAIYRALEKTRFNRTAAAKLLGVSFRALRYRMQRLNIQ
jgi:two-component system response regulator PilR (NtrC family)